jgi:uncharacterized protein YeaO (DUF488 family)
MIKATIKIKRVYENPQKEDGIRILVDRLWPRGLSKNKAKVDVWLKEIAPSNKLRNWFHHDPAKWEEFIKQYAVELRANKEVVNKLKALTHRQKVITLVFGAKDVEHNNAVALKKFLNYEIE